MWDRQAVTGVHLVLTKALGFDFCPYELIEAIVGRSSLRELQFSHYSRGYIF
jgi:hypothetical protein